MKTKILFLIKYNAEYNDDNSSILTDKRSKISIIWNLKNCILYVNKNMIYMIIFRSV